jgi:MiaB-like tRNA modifying enzyme
MARVFIETYGCTLNQADSDMMHALLEESHSVVDSEEESEVIVLNTCTVKGATENKILERIRSLAAKKRKFVVAGCLTVNSKKIRKFAPSAPIVAPSALRRINDAVVAALEYRPVSFMGNEPKDGLPRILLLPIARIPINEGCVSACHFCQTRLARPRLTSYMPKSIVKQINGSVRKGAREIQLTSMDLGAYGLDIKTDLADLLKLIAEDESRSRTETEFRIRLGMINPNHAKRMLPDILSALKHPRFYKFLHIPVQCGSEKVCKAMNRDHTVKDFVDIVRTMRKEIPQITIASDIIAGYPTETDEDFQQTKKLLMEIKPDIVNVSKFSARPGTHAKELKQLHNNEIKRRSAETAALAKEIAIKRRKALIGKKYRILVTEKQKDFTGRNINYMQVVVKGFKGELGDFVNVRITDANHGCLFGEIED